MRHGIRTPLGLLLVALGAAACKPGKITVNNFNDAEANGGTGNPGAKACAVGQVQKVAITPDSVPNAQVGGTQQFSASVDCGENIFTWSTTVPTVINVSQTGSARFIALGSGDVCATSAAGTKACAKVRVTGPTGPAGPTISGITLSPTQLNLLLGGTNCSGSLPQQITVVFAPADLPQSDRGLTWATSNANVANVSNTGLVSVVGVGTAVITATSTSNTAVKNTSNVIVSACTPGSFSITPHGPFTFNSNPNCLSPAIQLSALAANGSPVQVTWSSSNSAAATVNASGLVSVVPSASGNGTITATPQAGVPGSETFVVANVACQGGSPSITSVVVTPSTFQLILGGGGVALNAVVTAVGGASTAVTWSVNKQSCVRLSSTSGATITVTPLSLCTGVIVTATSDFDTNKSGSSTGSVGSGTISCSFQSNVGQQTDNVTIKLSVGQQAVLTGACTNQYGTGFIPFWYTDKPTIINVIGATTAIVINNQTYFAGPQATIKGIAAGQAQVFMQANVADQTLLFKQTVIIQ